MSRTIEEAIKNRDARVRADERRLIANAITEAAADAQHTNESRRVLLGVARALYKHA